MLTLNKELGDRLAQGLLKIYEENYPTIMEFIRTALDKGETPESIKKFLVKNTGDKLQSAQVFIIASYLERRNHESKV